jgi:hypothetical protein
MASTIPCCNETKCVSTTAPQEGGGCAQQAWHAAHSFTRHDLITAAPAPSKVIAASTSCPGTSASGRPQEGGSLATSPRPPRRMPPTFARSPTSCSVPETSPGRHSPAHLVIAPRMGGTDSSCQKPCQRPLRARATAAGRSYCHIASLQHLAGGPLPSAAHQNTPQTWLPGGDLVSGGHGAHFLDPWLPAKVFQGQGVHAAAPALALYDPGGQASGREVPE